MSGMSVERGNADFRNIHFGANESRADRIARLEDITRGNPNIKIDRESFNKILQGGNEIDLRLDLEAPDRRNLFIGAFASLAQLAGGLNGSAYNDALGSAITNRLGGDTDFLVRHGDVYKLGLFGGAEAQSGQIKVHESAASPTSPSGENIDVAAASKKLLEAQATSTTTQRNKPTQRGTHVDEGTDAIFHREHGYGSQELTTAGNTGSTEEGTSSNNKTRKIAGGQFGKHNVDHGGIRQNGDGTTREVIASIYVYGKDKKRGNEVNYLEGDDLRDKAGHLIAGSQEKLEARKEAVRNYAQLAVTAGLIDQSEVTAAGNDPKKLKALFQNIENKLNAKYGGDNTTRATLNDGFLGDHHISTIQRAINDRLKFNQGGAVAINDAVNGDISKVTTDQKRSALQFLGQSTKNSDGTELTDDQIDQRFKVFADAAKSKDPAVLQQARVALVSIERAQKDVLFGKGGENNSVKGGLFGTANGAFAAHNTILSQNINSTGLFNASTLRVDGAGKTEAQINAANSKLSSLGSSIAGAGVVASLAGKKDEGTGAQQTFTSQIQNLDAFIQEQISGKGNQTTTTETSPQVSLNLTEDGKTTTTTGTVEEVAKKLETDIRTKGVAVDPASLKDVIRVLQGNLAAQHAQGTITDAEFKKATDAIASLQTTNNEVGGKSFSTVSTKNTTDIANVTAFLGRAGNNTVEQTKKAETATKKIEQNVDIEVELALRQGGVDSATIAKLRESNGGSLANIKVNDLNNLFKPDSGATTEQIKQMEKAKEILGKTGEGTIGAKISSFQALKSKVDTSSRASVATQNAATVSRSTQKPAEQTLAALSESVKSEPKKAVAGKPKEATIGDFLLQKEARSDEDGEKGKNSLSPAMQAVFKILAEILTEVSDFFNSIVTGNFKSISERRQNTFNKTNQAENDGRANNERQKYIDSFTAEQKAEIDKIQDPAQKSKKQDSFLTDEQMESINKTRSETPAAILEAQKKEIEMLTKKEEADAKIFNLAGNLAKGKFAQADEILQKMAGTQGFQEVFSYGFTGDNAGRITTQDSLEQQYNAVARVGQNSVAAFGKIELYDKNEKARAKLLSLSTGIDKYNKNKANFQLDNPDATVGSEFTVEKSAQAKRRENDYGVGSNGRWTIAKMISGVTSDKR